MLSAATAALLGSPLPVRGRERRYRSDQQHQGTALTTSSAGNITIETTGAISIKAGSAAVTINSNNSVTNQGGISNPNTSNVDRLSLIDTTAGNIVAPAAGLDNLGTIDLSGDGNTKTGIEIMGGNPYLFRQYRRHCVHHDIDQQHRPGPVHQCRRLEHRGAGRYVHGLFNFAQGTTLDGDVSAWAGRFP